MSTDLSEAAGNGADNATGDAAATGDGAAQPEPPASRPESLHILAAVVENKFGVLARIAGLFSRRGFNIYSLAVAPTSDPTFSRVTIVVDVAETNLSQISKQLNKLVNVVHISELPPAACVERELMMARVRFDDRAARTAIGEAIAPYGGSVLDERDGELIVSVDAHPDQLDRCEAQLRDFGLVVLQRTGRIALRTLAEEAPPIGVAN